MAMCIWNKLSCCLPVTDVPSITCVFLEAIVFKGVSSPTRGQWQSPGRSGPPREVGTRYGCISCIIGVKA